MKRAILFVGVVTLAICTARVGNSASTSGSNSAESVAGPLQEGELPPGPNFALYKSSCLTCHTSSYVIQAPKSPRSYWEEEVKKMVDLYDAPIKAPEQKKIVDYLMSVRGLSGKPAK